MATTKYNFTNAQYQTIIHKAVTDGKQVDTNLIAEVMGDAFNHKRHTLEEFARKDSHMFHVATAKTAKSGKSIKNEENIALAHEFLDSIGFGKVFYLDDIKAVCPKVNSASKACKVKNALDTFATVRDAQSERKNKKAYMVVE